MVAVGSFSTSAEAEVSPQDQVPIGMTETGKRYVQVRSTKKDNDKLLGTEVELEWGVYKWKSTNIYVTYSRKFI